ncbi:hypothetical protein [Actinopolyspora halophila]|uniref:hypothetical protein n=1 Tax=Actinopolyspora halophila TaxID=1850 RepID=UPI0012F8B7B7|nr:hypothetical protein [Actinopolyspora halophila]
MLNIALRWLKVAVVIVVALVALGWFMRNAAFAGQQVGGFFTSIQVFLTNSLSASPLG